MLRKNYQNHWVGISGQAISKRLKQLRMIEKEGYWVLHDLFYELKSRNVGRRLFACEQLLERQKQKGFLHRIVTGDDSCQKWVHYNDPKRRRKSWGLTGGHIATSIPRSNIHGGGPA
nr:Mariner Mos1 transposase [Hymenolepis microstoma]